MARYADFRSSPKSGTGSAAHPFRALRRLKKFQGASRRRSLTFCNNFAVCSFSAAERPRKAPHRLQRGAS